jgi:serine/threonine protein kinase
MSTSTTTNAIPLANSEFGPYDILRELGRGAMGVVYLAVHRNLNRQCALKTISLKFKDPLAAERFIHEGQAVAKLGKHRHIAQVFDAGIVGNTPYIAMEFVEGETLEDRAARKGPFSEPELIEIGSKIALALDHAHRRGIVHRDVKLANVMIDLEGEPQLLDFGIAKDVSSMTGGIGSAGRRGEVTETGATESQYNIADASAVEATFVGTGSESARGSEEGIQGTPAYMAPEQADPRRGPVDARSDVYALGATLYVLAAGRRPFEAATITDLLLKVVTVRPPAISSQVDISADLEAVILKAMEKEPGDRYRTALEFADDLSRVTMGLPTRARKLGVLGWVGKRLYAHRRTVSVVAGALVLAGLLSTYFMYRSRETQALWQDVAERTARATAQEVRSLLDPALPMLRECVSLAESGLLPIDDQELLSRHLVARFRYQTKLSWLSFGDSRGRFTGAWRHATNRIVVQRSWREESQGFVREQFVDGEQERLKWSDDWAYDPRQRPFYQLASATQEPIWTEPYEWFAGEGMGITSALALREPTSGAVLGVFTADYHLGGLADFLANSKLGKNGRAYLLQRGGSLLASPERGAITPDGLLASAIDKSRGALPVSIDVLPFDEPHSFSFRHDGVAYVAAVEAFEPAAGLPVVTVVVVPEDDITGPLKRAAYRLAQVLGGLTTVAVAMSIVASIVQRRRLIKALGRRKRLLKPKRKQEILVATGKVADASAFEATSLSSLEQVDGNR